MNLNGLDQANKSIVNVSVVNYILDYVREGK